MSIEKQYDTPPPPPPLKQVSARAGEKLIALVQRDTYGGIYISVKNGTWPKAEARGIAEGILEILDSQEGA